MKRLLPLVLALVCLPSLSSAQASAASTQDDVATVRDRYALGLLPATPAAIDGLAAQSAKYSASMAPDGSWADIDYKASDRALWVTCDHLERVAAMAREARLERNAGHPDDALVAKALQGLAWWTNHDYQNPNWWWNEIHVPQLMGEIGNLLAPQIPAADIAKMVKTMKRSDWEHGPKHTWTGANLTWGVAIQIARGCLENNEDTVAQGFDRMYQEIQVVGPTEQGIQQDGSFHQHGNQLYNGGYGMELAVDSGRFAVLAQGTRFRIPADRMAILVNYLLDGQQWVMRGGLVDYSTNGRGITRERRVNAPNYGSTESARSLGAMLAALAADAGPRQKELQDFAARVQSKDGAPELNGNRQFWCSDFMVHRRPGYYTSVKMLSNRMQNAELVNSEGKKSVHLSDGANYLYISGDEYADVFAAWDWGHVPGTTAIQGTMATGEKDPIAAPGTTTFDGGVSDGTYGLAAMDLARGKLTAKKAWFFFDGSYEALGAGITMTGDPAHSVATDVNQARLIDSVLSSQTHGAVPGGTQTFNAANGLSVLHNHVGYIFGPDSKVVLFTGPRTGKWSDIGAGSADPVTVPVFDLWIDHGQSPQDAGYEYTVLPNATVERLAQIAKSPELTVLSNTDDIQAVYSASQKLVEVAFRKEGMLATPLGEVEVDHSCLMMVRQTPGGFKVTVSNPENQPLSMNLAVSQSQAAINLPGGKMAGSSVTVELK